jgi:hypothetical protein
VPLVVGAAALLVIAVVATAVAIMLTHHDAEEPSSIRGNAAAGAPSPTGPTTCSADPLLEAEFVDLTPEDLR